MLTQTTRTGLCLGCEFYRSRLMSYLAGQTRIGATMCGIVAIAQIGSTRIEQGERDGLHGQLQESLELIRHRGPDGDGIWIEEQGACALAHCRLAINDLSPSGSQPLHSADNSLHAIVNGEIYDHDRLRADLQARGYTFGGHSDSELVLALYQFHDLSFLDHLRGEFALCLYDGRRKRFIAARDRYGVKPLFWRYGKGGKRVEFAAEIKAFKGLGWEAEWDVQAVISAGCMQDARTSFKGISKLRPGHYMLIEDGAEPILTQYWDITYPDKRTPETRSTEDIIASLRAQLIDSVRLRLRADVPVGIYLSGGIDSSALAGIATYLAKEEGVSMGSQDVKDAVCCFSIGFDKASGNDESDIAERTAKHLGVRFLKQHMDESALASNFADAIYHCEHHTHDLNFVGKYVLSRLPRENGYKVVLTGEGSDEQFGGYNQYYPDFLMGEGVSVDIVQKAIEENDVTYQVVGGDVGSYLGPSRAKEAMGDLTTPVWMLAFHPPYRIFSPWVIKAASETPLDTIANNVPPDVLEKIRTSWHGLHGAHYIWSKGHLANQFLSCLGDRVEMSHSVEARVPYLDHHLTEYINGLPASLKIRVEEGKDPVEKWILREAVKPFITKELFERKKYAYTAPAAYKEGGPVHTMLQGLVNEDKVRRLGFVEWAEVQGLWKEAFRQSEGLEETEKGRIMWAWRMLLVVASWVVLSERFKVATAQPA